MARSALALRAPARRKPVPLAAPFLKWAGGKSRLLGEILPRVPRTYVRYYEPFVGGGAVFFGLAPHEATLTDANPELIGCYRAVRDDVGAVIRALRIHKRRHSDEYYYLMREGWNAGGEIGSPERAAAFIYLNKTCYNGLWRVNSRGKFNVPVGRYVNPAILDEDGLRQASRLLANADLRTAPFESILDEARAGDFVYFDPPYVPVSATSDFTSYTAESFTMADQRRLADVFRELAQRGCAVMLSNSDTPEVRRLYAGFRVQRVFCSRAINSRAQSRGAVAEVLVTNDY